MVGIAMFEKTKKKVCIMIYEATQDAIAKKVSKELADEEYPNKIVIDGTKDEILDDGTIITVKNIKIQSTENLNTDELKVFNLMKDGISLDLAKQNQKEMMNEIQNEKK